MPPANRQASAGRPARPSATSSTSAVIVGASRVLGPYRPPGSSAPLQARHFYDHVILYMDGGCRTVHPYLPVVERKCHVGPRIGPPGGDQLPDTPSKMSLTFHDHE